MSLEKYSQEWAILYNKESQKICVILGDAIEDIQHIGSTAIPGILAKPIIDIAIMLNSFDAIQDLIKRLSGIGYIYAQKKSSSERYFFEKNNLFKYHLSLTIPSVSYWRRQILFRDYLIKHPKIAKEYETLKKSLLEKNADGASGYIEGKSKFIAKILKLAENEK